MAPKKAMATTLAISLIVTLMLQGVVSVHVKDLVVPPHPERKTNVTLRCNYDIGTDELYAIKWFHNNVEIYRYMPNEKPQIDIYANENLEIVESESKPDKILLKEVNLTAAGEYKCEVNTDWPLFKQDIMSKNMTVVVIPQDQPNIEGDVGGHYSVGNWVNLNCTAAPSIPPAALVWLINDKEAPEKYLHEYEVRKQDDGLMVSNLGLRFKLANKDFKKGELKLKCTATIATWYSSSDEHSQQDPTADVKEVRERPSEGSLVTNTGNTGHNAVWATVNQRTLGVSLVSVFFCVTLLW